MPGFGVIQPAEGPIPASNRGSPGPKGSDQEQPDAELPPAGQVTQPLWRRE